MSASRPARRILPALLLLLSLWSLAGWWSLVVPSAQAWTRMIPMPIGLSAAALWWLLFARGRCASRKIAMALITAGLVAGFLRDTGGLKRNIHDISGPELRIAQWTMAAETNENGILSAFLEDQPHVVVLNRPNTNQIFTIKAPSLRLRYNLDDGTIFIFSQYRMKRLAMLDLPGARALYVEIAMPEGPVNLLAMNAQRGELSKSTVIAMNHWLQTRRDGRPLIIAGGQGRSRVDAVWQPLRPWMVPVYEKAGYGWPYSWPRPVPLFADDHLWVSSDIRVQRAFYRAAGQSRHLRQAATLTLPNTP